MKQHVTLPITSLLSILLALGVTASFSGILAARGLWNLRWRQSR